jgi:cytochrome c peroxidase
MTKQRRFGAGLAGALLLLSHLPGEAPPLGLDLFRPVPEDNPITREKVALGERLFHERLLSRDESRTCADCHQPKRAFTDGLAKAVGVYGRQGPRSVPTLVNRAWGESFFWDGRIATLERQVVQPILAETEMDLTLEEAVERLGGKRRYRRDFQRAFGRDPNADDLARALAAYVRTILSGDSPFDRYLFGDHEALSEQELAGLKIFRGKANCTFCHSGPTFTDEEFHNTGVAWRDSEWLDDGRFTVTQDERDRGKFKTPTLREVGRTGPYMHDGSFATLEDVVNFYSDGNRPNPNLDPELRRLNLTGEEKAQLVAFLRALTGSVRAGN